MKALAGVSSALLLALVLGAGAAAKQVRPPAPPPNGSTGALPDGAPVPGAVLTQGFGCTAFTFEPPDERCLDLGGHFHGGIDLAAPAGTPVLTPAAGRVQTGYQAGSCGLFAFVDHGGGWSTLYCHLSAVTVAPGELAQAGEPLGEVGSSGNSTGPHLHFEVHRAGVPVDPIGWLAVLGAVT